jgi:hypothetical protein
MYFSFMVKIHCLPKPYIWKLAHRLFTLYWVLSNWEWPLLRGLSCSQDQDHVHPDISTDLTLRVHKNMPFAQKSISYTWRRQKRLLGLQINASCFKMVINLSKFIVWQAETWGYVKKENRQVLKKRRERKRKMQNQNNSSWSLCLKKAFHCLKREIPVSRSKVELG